jgi:hypothetical protein
MCDECKELFVFRGVGLESLAKGFGFGKAERSSAMGVEFGAVVVVVPSIERRI